MMPKNRRPVHPGEILRKEYLEPLKMSQQQLADALGVTRVRINEIILGKRSVTPDTSFRLSRYFKTTPDFWLNLQTAYDLKIAQREIGQIIENEVRERRTAA